MAATSAAATTVSGAWRVHVRRDTFGTTDLILVVGTPLSDVTRERREAAEAMLVGIPLGLLLAAAGGLWLATVGLAPISAMIERLGASLKTQRQFMADASHELRTPVSVVRTAADVTLSREHRDEAEYREALAIVGGQARHLGRLVDDMLMLARADAGGYALRVVDLYLDELIEGCRRTLDVLAAERGVRIRVAPLPEMPFRGDEDLLRQLVTNILQNAVQHTPCGGSVELTVARAADRIAIRVTDSGPGIAPADQQRIFDRFVQLDPARRLQGTGLGLPIARWIAEAHRGALTLERSGPTGSTFCVSLPLSSAQSVV
jgi:signal transduction histidine kinase